jgi:hypothetical protein
MGRVRSDLGPDPTPSPSPTQGGEQFSPFPSSLSLPRGEGGRGVRSAPKSERTPWEQAPYARFALVHYNGPHLPQKETHT